MAGKKNRKQQLAADNAKKANAPASPPITSSAQTAHLLKKALSLHRKQNLSKAANSYRMMLASEPTHPDALHLLGLTYGQSHHHQKAIELYNQSIK